MRILEKLLEGGSGPAMGAGGTLLTIVLVALISWLRIRGTVLGHMVTRAEKLERLLKEERDSGHERLKDQRDYYEARIESLVARHQRDYRELEERYDDLAQRYSQIHQAVVELRQRLSAQETDGHNPSGDQ